MYFLIIINYNIVMLIIFFLRLTIVPIYFYCLVFLLHSVYYNIIPSEYQQYVPTVFNTCSLFQNLKFDVVTNI